MSILDVIFYNKNLLFKRQSSGTLIIKGGAHLIGLPYL